MKRAALSIVLVLFFLHAEAGPSVDTELAAAISASPLDLHPVVITFDSPPTGMTMTRLNLLGIVDGYVLEELPMVLTRVTALQFNKLQNEPGVVSLYGNRIHQPLTNASRDFIGQAALQRDAEVTATNGGVPVSGRGIGVAVVDTGLDASHRDHELGGNVVQNVYSPLADVPLNFPSGLVPPVHLEDQPMTDIEGGHGTFVTGVVGATGAMSGNFYGGVAPGADLIGLVAGNDAGLSTFAIVQAYDWILVNQFRYNIRVVNNSFGSNLGEADNYDPLDPINVGTRKMHDRFIAVVFAAGNSGDVPGAINRLAVAPWVISVAAGQKEGLGSPAGFSSRGEDNGSGVDSAGQPADPHQAPNLRPDITAPGVAIKSTRSKGPGLTNLLGTALGQDLDIPPAFLPFYTTSQGTSFAAPHVAGVAALMLEVNPRLTPQDIMEILRETAMPMPFEERVVGAGYVDAHNAVRRAMALAPVDPPADLIPGPDTPEIVDARGDQLGTQSQDIISGRFEYAVDSDRLVYTLELADLEEIAPNSRWTQSSQFGDVRVFVSTNVTELGEITHTWGTIAPDPDTGVNTQTNLGEADAGRIEDNFIIVELGLDPISQAAGHDVFGTVSTSTAAQSQILIGTSVTGGLLLNADSASGREFTVGPDDSDEDSDNGDHDENGDDGETRCDGPGVNERHADAAEPGEQPLVVFTQQCSELSVQLTYNPGKVDLHLTLHDSEGNPIAAAGHGNGRRLNASGLEPGDYAIQVNGDLDQAIDYVLQLRQRD